MENQTNATGLRLFVWIPASELPTPEEGRPEGYTMLLAIDMVGVTSGFYLHEKAQFYQNCQRYDSFDDEPVEGWTREQEINNNLEWETEEVYPEGHDLAEYGTTVTYWMLIPDAPIE